MNDGPHHDETARQMIRDHVEHCDGRMVELRALVADIWTAIDGLRSWRVKILHGAIAFLLLLVVSLAGYIWKTGGGP